MTPESLPEELPPQIWNTWPSSDNVTFDMPDIASEIDWVSHICAPLWLLLTTYLEFVGFYHDGPRSHATAYELGQLKQYHHGELDGRGLQC
jgi:hypothetical protein